jgi:hypothetical protein
MRKLKWTLLGALGSIVLIVGSLWLYLNFKTGDGIDAHHLIPEDAIFVFESEKPLTRWNELQKNELWNFLTKHPYFGSINEDAASLNSMLEGNRKMLKLFGNKKFICSAHLISKNDYDFMFAVDLSSAGDILKAGNTLSEILAQAGLKVSKSEHREVQILAATDTASKSVLYLAQVENYLVCSYQLPILRKSIEAYRNPIIAQNIHFNRVFRKIENDGFGSLFVQWKYMGDYLDLYQKRSSPWLESITQSMSFGAYDLNLNGNSIEMTGYAHRFDSTSSYLSALMNSGFGKSNVDQILTNRTAYYWSLCYDEATVLYQNLMKSMKDNQVELASFEKNKKRIEDYLEISLEKDFISWMGGELVLAQSKKFNASTKDEYFALIHLKNKDLAVERLQHISNQIKKKTPAKFKQIHFRNYTLQYIELKGTFKLLFGSLFDKFQTPYYTFIDDYVVFSNSAMGIVGLIEDYEHKRVLANAINFHKPESNSHSALLYVAPQNTFTVLTSKLTTSKSSDLKKSKEYFEGFGGFYVSLTSQKDLIYFQTQLQLRLPESSDQISSTDIRSLWQQRDPSQNQEPQFVLRIIEDGIYKQYYPNSEKIFIDAKTKWGIMHGKYTEYNKNGTLKAKGKYRKGQRVGLWKFYNMEGEQTSKKRY